MRDEKSIKQSCGFNVNVNFRKSSSNFSPETKANQLTTSIHIQHTHIYILILKVNLNSSTIKKFIDVPMLKL